MELKYKTYNELPLKVFNKMLNLNIADEVNYEIELLSLLADVQIDDILNLTLTQYQHIRQQAEFITGFPRENNIAPDNLVINEHKYYLCKNLKQITAAQYIDYNNYLKMENRKYEYLLSCFIIPEGKKYNEGYDIDKVIDDILDLDMVSVVNICFFFLMLLETSTLTMLHYLESKLKKMKRKEKNQEMKQKIVETQNLIHLMKNGLGL